MSETLENTWFGLSKDSEMGKGLGKVALVGPGAVGGFYGGMLSNSGVDLKFIFRSSYDQVCQKGLWLVHHCDDRQEEGWILFIPFATLARSGNATG